MMRRRNRKKSQNIDTRSSQVASPRWQSKDTSLIGSKMKFKPRIKNIRSSKKVEIQLEMVHLTLIGSDTELLEDNH